MDTLTVNITSEIGICQECLVAGKKQAISVIISPLKVTNENNILRVTSGCNMWKGCENKKCQFSLISHERSKI